MTTSAYIPENDLRVKVEFAIGALAQIWKCSFGGNLRQWGLLWPEDKNGMRGFCDRNSAWLFWVMLLVLSVAVR